MNLKNKNGETALIIATKKNLKEMLEVLLNKNANPDIGDVNGDTPLHHAVKMAEKGLIEKIFEFLPNENIGNKSGIKPFDFTNPKAKAKLLWKFQDIINKSEDDMEEKYYPHSPKSREKEYKTIEHCDKNAKSDSTRSNIIRNPQRLSPSTLENGI